MAMLTISALMKKYSEGRLLRLLTLANSFLLIMALMGYTTSDQYLKSSKDQYAAHLVTRNTIASMPTQPATTVYQKLTDADLLSIFNKTAADAQVTLNRIGAKDDSIDVAIDNQQWDTILLWLEKLESTDSGLRLVKLSSHVNSSKHDGKTNTTLSFAKP